ncbi:MAG: hypothetical protein NTY19_07670 [Planctomycetota bacterium]|nr:hypothetical protein [Planctomycetota bacterium]
MPTTGNTAQEHPAGPVVPLGPVTLDLQRLTVDEVTGQQQALQKEIWRRHAERQSEPEGLATAPRNALDARQADISAMDPAAGRVN